MLHREAGSIALRLLVASVQPFFDLYDCAKHHERGGGGRGRGLVRGVDLRGPRHCRGGVLWQSGFGRWICQCSFIRGPYTLNRAGKQPKRIGAGYALRVTGCEVRLDSGLQIE